MRCSELLLGALLLAGCDADAPAAASPPPPDGEDLQAVQAWLFDGDYLDWQRHAPAPGMVGGAIVYLSPALAASLHDGHSSHPLGAAAVRELVSAESGEMIGWAYMLKLDDAPDGDGWFFYEVFATTRDAAANLAERGAPGCVGCHADGVDFIHAP